jgi:NAD(P)-dependent dehydrogenase (short-subunit alcohol dehydrogenase family)
MTEAFVGELFSVKDKVILVTGSNRGYGYAIAEGLNKAGAIVIRIDLSFDTRSNTDDFEFDLANKIQIKSLVEKINKKYGRIDALVNNAGVSISSANLTQTMKHTKKL